MSCRLSVERLLSIDYEPAKHVFFLFNNLIVWKSRMRLIGSHEVDCKILGGLLVRDRSHSIVMVL